MAGNQAVAKKAESLPANLMDDLYAGAGQGMENITAEDMQIPFMRILQPLSPQLIKTDSKFIKGASAGDIFNTVTGQFWEGDEGVTIIPCAYEMKFLEFQLRESGGGFLGEIDPNNPDIRQANRVGANEMLPSGNELVRAAQFLVVAIGEDGATQQMILDMKKNPDEGCQAVEYSPCGYEADAPGEGSVYSAHVGYGVEAEDCAGEQR